ncbi:uncharacterized protein LOC127867938 [Dreissena polymorpha]|nr:uncharacterized protein LOC127867938 [Dreissena polymorpha]
MTTLKQLVGVDEPIKNVWVYKVPLKKKQLTFVFLFHQYLVFETKKWWWSIEKHTDAITIQRSTEASFVKDFFRRKPRITGRHCLKKSTGRGAIYKLIEWIKNNGELHKQYNVIHSNCKHFADAVFNQVATSHDAQPRHSFVIRKRKSSRSSMLFTSKIGNKTNEDVQSISAFEGGEECTEQETQTSVPSVGIYQYEPISRRTSFPRTLFPMEHTRNIDNVKEYLQSVSGCTEQETQTSVPSVGIYQYKPISRRTSFPRTLFPMEHTRNIDNVKEYLQSVSGCTEQETQTSVPSVGIYQYEPISRRTSFPRTLFPMEHTRNIDNVKEYLQSVSGCTEQETQTSAPSVGILQYEPISRRLLDDEEYLRPKGADVATASYHEHDMKNGCYLTDHEEIVQQPIVKSEVIGGDEMDDINTRIFQYLDDLWYQEFLEMQEKEEKQKDQENPEDQEKHEYHEEQEYHADQENQEEQEDQEK